MFGVCIALPLLVSCSLDVSNRDEAPELRTIEVDPAHQECEGADDCGLVFVDCSGCDCGIPVNLQFEDRYLQLYSEVCLDYVGPVCEMYCPEVELICQAGVCEANPIQ